MISVTHFAWHGVPLDVSAPWLSGTRETSCRCIRSMNTPISISQVAVPSFKPSFSGCRRQDLECTAWQCCLATMHRLILAPAIVLLLALLCTLYSDFLGGKSVITNILDILKTDATIEILNDWLIHVYKHEYLLRLDKRNIHTVNWN